eukprot:2131126-Pyramimonas_sp.AAC.2
MKQQPARLRPLAGPAGAASAYGKHWWCLRIFWGRIKFESRWAGECLTKLLVRCSSWWAVAGGPHDAKGAIVTITAGAGGLDAMDWAAMLERMYLR